ncbi:hypothetical protein SAMN04515667_1984 [Formosa sp. Hel1_31_208]|uniref:hypothetical protein n=1 Tax=Formosa sp. Hel1_31_208 TaxID=1798225 RepID=UPI00087951B5|nr:hypothetical protein [Formosa sp. Hel1_31_208]SDS35384.1 hypothetical protein SAMN04515667_1984 [Formosa sp. Hel1_31_208]
MSIFNKKRMGFLSKKKLSSYLLYGIGEIILVVIGILIAVTINNKKQERDAQNQLRSYLQVYKQDLIQDTTIIHAVLETYVEKRKEYFKLFLSDTVTAKTYAETPQGYGLILSYTPFQLQQKGINLLEKYVNDRDSEQDTLISTILTSYRTFDNLLTATNNRIGDDIDNNMLYFKENEPWIADILMGKLDNPEIMRYYLSDAYRARLAIHSTLIYGNLEPQLKALKETDKEILELINERLKK